MSFCLMTPCWYCAFGPQGDDSCKDGERIRGGVNQAHAGGDEHKGSGNILVQCIRFKNRV